jgi:3D (Asp-Asp-Asp) domain-containing protein
VGPLTRRWPLLAAATLAATASITGTTPFQWGTDPAGAETAPAVQKQAASSRQAEATAVVQLYATEAALARARVDLSQLEDRSARLAREEASARRQTELVRRSLTASQRRVAVLLRDLYVRGAPDPIAVILGATSLDEAMVGIEGLSRATALNERLGVEARQRARQLDLLGADLVIRRTTLDGARNAARAGAERYTAAVSEQRRTVSTLRRLQGLTVQRLTVLESRARAAERRSAELTAEAADAVDPTTGSDPSPPLTTATTSAPVTPHGTRTLVVDVVAYHLSGSTASGLPVGVGVIAVDPAVIPLGTRVFVPGYGPAVAADVGSSIRGNIIDLWMPSRAKAQAWGRRSVTITVYR